MDKLICDVKGSLHRLLFVAGGEIGCDTSVAKPWGFGAKLCRRQSNALFWISTGFGLLNLNAVCSYIFCRVNSIGRESVSIESQWH